MNFHAMKWFNSKTMSVISALQSSQLFASLNIDILKHIAELAQEKTFLAGDLLLREGEPAQYCFIIISGQVEVFREFGLPQRLDINTLGAGEIVGELAIIDGLPRSASVVAQEFTKTLAISAWDFKVQMQNFPQIALELLPIIAKRLRQTQTQLTQLVQ